ncbi:MAG: DMT family transporter [Terriglobales bacterium]
MPAGPSTASQARPRAAASDAALLAVTLIWGITFPLVKSALRDADALSFCAVRLTLAALLLAAWYRLDWRRLPAATWVAGALLGLCLAAGYALQTAGLALTAPATAAFITSMYVVLVPLLLAGFWRRKLRPVVWACTGVVLLGLYLLVAPPVGGAATSSSAWRGEGLVALCALAFALQVVLLGEWAPRMKFRDLAVLQVVFAAVFSWFTLPLSTHPHWANTPRLWIAIAITAVLATAVAFTVQSWAQQFTPSTHAAVIFAAEPVFAWLASAIFWNEPLGKVQLIGAALVVLAIVGVEGRANVPDGARPG